MLCSYDNIKEQIMTDLKIRIFKNNQSHPETTITIPGRVLTVASKLIPKRATEALQEKGIDINELIELSKKPDVQGTIIEVEEHKKKEKIIIALE
jgi:hypothetical protein